MPESQTTQLPLLQTQVSGSPWAATVTSGTCTTGTATGGDTTGTSHAIKCKGAAVIGARVRPRCFAFRLPQARAVIAALPTASVLAVSLSPFELPAYGIGQGLVNKRQRRVGNERARTLLTLSLSSTDSTPSARRALNALA